MKSIFAFSAAWCPNCPRMKPVWEKLKEDHEVNVIDVDEYPEKAKDWGVQSLPTTLIVENEEEVDRVVGARPYSFMLEKLKD